MRLDALPGQVLDGKYRIERQLGAGGMGAVFLALHLGTTRTVALKVIVPQLAHHEEFLLRFGREAEAAGRLRHPNVVNVTDFGVTRVEGAEIAYLVMEYLDGRTLADFLKLDPRPHLPLVFDVLDQVALALDAAHEKGIVHRDLKPDNIWLESNLRGGYNVKVLDFGIAKVESPLAARAAAATAAPAALETVVLPAPTGSDETQVIAPAPLTARAASSTLQTTVGSVLGTPAYMSPEQCLGAPVDRRADIYSLAVIAYQMLVGELPFDAPNVTAMLEAHVRAEPVAPRLRRPSLQAALEAAVLGGLAKDRDLRPASAGAFATRVRAAAECEAGVMRAAKDMVNTNAGPFLTALAVIFAPLIPVLLAAAGLGRLAHDSRLLPPLAAMAAIFSVEILGVYACAQLFKAASALLLVRASQSGRFTSGAGAAAAVLRSIPALAATQAASFLDWRPSTAGLHGLWPVLWATEGVAGKAAVVRSVELSRMLRPAAVSLVIRYYSTGLLAVLLFPVVIGALGPGLGELARILLSSGKFGLFFLLWPLVMTIVYVGYATMFPYFYWLTLRCRAEGDVPPLPAVRSRSESKSAPALRPATIGWLMFPLIAVVLIAVSQIVPRNRPRLMDPTADGRTARVRELLLAGVSPNGADPSGVTPLLNAVMRGNVTTAGLLLDKGANPNLASRWWSPLMAAAANNRPDLARLLLDRGARVNAANAEGRTALMFAAIRGNRELVTLLLSRGADPRAADREGRTAADFAVEEGFDELRPLLSR